MAAQTEQAVRIDIEVALIKHVVNVAWHTHTRIAQHLAKSAINVVTKIILVHVAGQMWAKTKDAGEIEHKLTAGGRSPERCHWPSRGRCSRSRSWSWSSGESVTDSAHSIEVDWYDIDDIDMSKTFHSIYRSRTVASRSNDTDPDSKTKIVTKIRIKLLHRWVVDNLQVKVDDGAEANMLPLCSFRSMFPHSSRWRQLPTRWIPQRFKDKIRMLQWWQIGKSWEHYIKAQTLHK